jgi:23S rRNA-/tRNA-specific pseudouridylate synthase
MRTLINLLISLIIVSSLQYRPVYKSYNRFGHLVQLSLLAHISPYSIANEEVARRLAAWRIASTRASPSNETITITIDGVSEDGIKAGIYLKGKYFSSSNKVHAVCKSGLVTCNGRKIFSSHKLHNGDLVSIMSSEGTIGAEVSIRAIERLSNFSASLLREDRNPPLHTIYEDDYMAIVFKPSGVHSLSWLGTLKKQLYCLDDVLPVVLYPPRVTHQLQFNDVLTRPIPCHRLDSRVCGCLVVAKAASVLEHLNAQFAERKVQKVYHALLIGSFPQPFPSSLDSDQKWMQPYCNHSNTFLLSYPVRGRPSESIVRVLESSLCNVYGEMHRVELSPLTGRRHQLRIHCALLGCPILGDDMYHEAGSLSSFQQRVRRIEQISREGEEGEEDKDAVSIQPPNGIAPDVVIDESAPTGSQVRKGVRRGQGLFLMAVGIRLTHPHPSTLQPASRFRQLSNGMGERVRIDGGTGEVEVSIDEVPRFQKVFAKAGKGASWPAASAVVR